MPDADACIFDGDSQVAACCALAGVPLVCTPPSVEGFLLAGRMIKAGIGAGVGLIAPNIRGRLKATLKEFATGGEEVRAVRALASLRAHLGDREAFLNIVKLIVLLGFTRTLNRRSEPLSTRVRKAGESCLSGNLGRAWGISRVKCRSHLSCGGAATRCCLRCAILLPASSFLHSTV